jgi:hypothetical protein
MLYRKLAKERFCSDSLRFLINLLYVFFLQLGASENNVSETEKKSWCYWSGAKLPCQKLPTTDMYAPSKAKYSLEVEVGVVLDSKRQKIYKKN